MFKAYLKLSSWYLLALCIDKYFGYDKVMDETPNSRDQQKINQLISAIDVAYNRPGLLMWRSLLSGLFSGIGATLGAAAIIILLGFLVRELGGLPVIGTWLNQIGQALPKR